MANNAKLALLRAKIDGQIQDLYVKTRADHVMYDDETHLLNYIVSNYVKQSDFSSLYQTVENLGTLASKNEVTEAELGEALKTLINSKAAQADLEALQQTVDNLGALGSKDKIEFSDLAEALQTLINGKADATALQAEVERATAAEEANAAAIKAISDDYLKAADKTELSNAIAAEKERAEGVEAGLQTQINTIMNNPDTEGVINSINEFTQYVADHGEIAEGFRTDIDALKQTAAGLGTLATKDIVTESEVDADLMAKINASAEGNHAHENKTVLDGITAEKVAAWDASEQNAKDHATGLNTAMNTRVEALETTAAGLGALATKDKVIADDLDDEFMGDLNALGETVANNTEAIAALNIKANVYTSTPSVDEIAEGQMFIELMENPR